jgi:DNA polymerase III subunit epsilon
LSIGDLAGYNLKKFDLPLLAYEFGRCWLDFQWTGRTIIDVFEIFRKQEPRDLAGAMSFYCGGPHEDAHAAHADVDATAMVLDAQLARYPDLPRTVRDLHERFAGVDIMGRFRREGDAIVFAFGKHAGRSLREVAAESPDYLRWMLEGDFLDDVKDLVRSAIAETCSA